MMKRLFTAVAICCMPCLYASPYAQEAGHALSPDSALIQTQSDSLASISHAKPHVVRRDFDGRQQVVVGTAIMTFLVVIITTVSNWNP